MKPAAGSAQVRRRSVTGAWDRRSDSLAVEEPLEIRVNARPIAVVMRTPGHDEELATGFLLAEGLIRRRDDIAMIRANPRNRHGNILEVVLADAVPVDFRTLSRHVFGASSCGLCGASSIAAIRRRFPRGREKFLVSAAWLAGLPESMRAAQAGFARTGGLHAAAWFEAGGGLECLREDVGRHNAVDKVSGWAFREGRLPASRAILLVSGRASFEIQQKALAAGVVLVAAIGAPTSLAVAFARSNGQTLVGFLRDGGFNVYAGARRIR